MIRGVITATNGPLMTPIQVQVFIVENTLFIVDHIQSLPAL